MEHKIVIKTYPTRDGKIIQELYRVDYNIREQIMRQVLDTQDQQIRNVLIGLGWTPPKENIYEINE